MYKLLALYFFYKLLRSSFEFEKSLEGENAIDLASIIMMVFSTITVVWAINK